MQTTVFDYESLFLTSLQQKRIHCIQFKTKQQQAKGQIVYFHGNAGSIASYQAVATTFCQAGYNCLIVDYLGYGHSEGIASHKSFLESGRTVARYVQQQDFRKPLILYGFSIGGHLSLTIAKEFPRLFDALITEGAFTSHKEIAVASVGKPLKFWARLLLKNPYPGIEAIKNVPIPKLVIHSLEDATVPYSMGLSYRDKAVDKISFWATEGRHGTAMQDSSLLFDHLTKLIESISPP